MLKSLKFVSHWAELNYRDFFANRSPPPLRFDKPPAELHKKSKDKNHDNLHPTEL